METFDLVVIGGGSGGVRAARIAAGHGARVALVEEYRMGGTCVIRGCVPKKLMVYASRFAQEFEEARGFGWTLGEARFDWPTLKAHRDREVARLEAVYRPEAGPDIPGAELAIDSNGFFELEQLPRRVVVQGAGYIALELACVLRLLGAEVTVVLRGTQILRGFDDELRTHLATELAATGLQFLYGRQVSAMVRNAQGLQVTLDDGQTLEADCVLRAVGRAPNSAGLGLEAAGVLLDARGAVQVDAQSRSSVDHIYAVGDVTNRVNLTPMAIREGHAFADTVFGQQPRQIDYRLIPSAVFTTPEAGVVGLTEEQALQQHPHLDVYRTTFKPMKAALSGPTMWKPSTRSVSRSTSSFMKMRPLCPDSGEIVQLVGVTLQLGATKAAFDATLAVHPTAAEELVTLRTPAVRHNL